MPIDSDSKLRAAVDWKRKSDEWIGFKTIVAITKEDLKFGRNTVEHVTAKDWWASALGQKTEKATGKVMCLGKYKGKTRAWIQENDESYDSWAAENIKGYDNL